MSARARDEDQRREWTLWVLIAADVADEPVATALERLESAFVGPAPEPDPSFETEFFRVPQFEDDLPEPEEWARRAEGVRTTAQLVENNRDEIDAIIREASPRWKIERMPIVDRTLLRIGVAELKFADEPRAKATLNGLIELAKQYGEVSSPRFVNGILDQIRRNLGVPFS